MHFTSVIQLMFKKIMLPCWVAAAVSEINLILSILRITVSYSNSYHYHLAVE